MSQYTHIAFISYNHRDYLTAFNIQNRLEKYPYPQKDVLPENRPQHPKFIRSVVLDVSSLSTKRPNFNDEIKENIRQSKYLIVICSHNAKKSTFIKKEIDYFLKTHEDGIDKILPVFVNAVELGIHPIIDSITAQRTCPIYDTNVRYASFMRRKYCFYHIVEFLLKVDFDILYDRYEAYKRKKKVKRMIWFNTCMLLIIGALTFGIYHEHQRRIIATNLAKFERKTFPFSLVVGYVDNFLYPLENALDSIGSPSVVVVFMPNSYELLNHQSRETMFMDYINRNYNYPNKENIQFPRRHKPLTINKLTFPNSTTNVYIDNVTTISAFRSVIDYRMNESPIKIPLTEDELVIAYSNTFIEETEKRLKDNRVYFVMDTMQLRDTLNMLITNER